MLTFIIDRLKERSTWIGLITIITAAGIGITPEQGEAIAVAGVGIAGAVAVFTADK